MISSWFPGIDGDSLRLLPLVAICVGVVGLAIHVIRARCAALIGQWADENVMTVLSWKRRFLRTGPFGITPGMPVYLVTVEDSAGRERQAYIRCGDLLMGVLSNEIAVSWVSVETAV